MGADALATRPDLTAAADRALGWGLVDLCARGPEDQLTRTDRAQAALFVVGFALWEAFAAAAPGPPAAAAGHSLGEYTALAASGAVTFDDGLRLVAARGGAMARAADLEPSGMAALMGADRERAEALVAARRSHGGRLSVANFNAPGQIVVAGGVADLEWAAAAAAEFGVRRVVPLRVAGAFHSSFMEPAATELAGVMQGLAFGEPVFPVWANVTGRPHSGDIGAALLQQLTAAVRFDESLQAMARAGIGTFVHIGPGDVTAGLARRSIEGASTMVVSNLEEAEAVAAGLAAG